MPAKKASPPREPLPIVPLTVAARIRLAKKVCRLVARAKVLEAQLAINKKRSSIFEAQAKVAEDGLRSVAALETQSQHGRSPADWHLGVYAVGRAKAGLMEIRLLRQRVMEEKEKTLARKKVRVA